MGLDNDFFGMTPKAYSTKSKINMWEHINYKVLHSKKKKKKKNTAKWNNYKIGKKHL